MALVNEGGSLRVVNGALGTGQECCQGQCLPTCDESGYGCPDGYECCPQIVGIENNSFVSLRVCLPLYIENQEEGQCCFNFGANCNADAKTFAQCFCAHPYPYNNETVWIAGASCDDPCGNPFP